MYSMDELLQLLRAKRADELKLHVGCAPVLVIDGEPQPVEGPVITTENAEDLLHSITDTRHRRELRAHGVVQFIHRFRRSTDFVVCARIENDHVGLDIH